MHRGVLTFPDSLAARTPRTARSPAIDTSLAFLLSTYRSTTDGIHETAVAVGAVAEKLQVVKAKEKEKEKAKAKAIAAAMLLGVVAAVLVVAMWVETAETKEMVVTRLNTLGRYLGTLSLAVVAVKARVMG
jgi:hypothetical protein